jgi:hypothetical protein
MKIFFLILPIFISTNSGDKKIMIKLEKEHKTYKAIIPFGSQNQELSFMFSTGSSVSWIAGKECSDCHQEKYRENESESFRGNMTNYKSFNVYSV